MALKDWKKIGLNYYENKKENEWRIKIWPGLKVLHILKPTNSLTLPVWKSKKFKTKSQALKFAKAYMRKH